MHDSSSLHQKSRPGSLSLHKLTVCVHDPRHDHDVIVEFPHLSVRNAELRAVLLDPHDLARVPIDEDGEGGRWRIGGEDYIFCDDDEVFVGHCFLQRGEEK